MPTALNTFLQDRSKSPPIVLEAVLTRDVSPELFDHIELLWAPARQRLALQNEHRHWDWRVKQDDVRAGRQRVFTVSCWETVQGAMALEGHDRYTLTGEPLVYIAYIEAAPWNLESRSKRLHGVGSALIGAAIHWSIERECAGRIGLHSLPSAENFYGTTLRMTADPRRVSDQGLMYFEYDSEGAQAFLARTGL